MIPFNFKQVVVSFSLASVMSVACGAQAGGTLPATESSLPTATLNSPPLAPTLAPTATAIPVPAGWLLFEGGDPLPAFYHPPDWTPVVIDPRHAEIRPADGFAWMEISVIDAANPGPDSLLYAQGGDTGAMAEALAQTLREDGAFDDPVGLAARGGAAAWIIVGRNDRFADNQVVGLVGLGDGVALLIGHQGEGGEDWGILQEIYRQIIQSVGA